HTRLQGDWSSDVCSSDLALLESYRVAVQRGETEAMEAAALRFMAFACEQSEKDPSADLRLNIQAHEHEAAGDWEKAEAAYRQVRSEERRVGKECRSGRWR